ncbi:Protein RGF1 INDUCIBLE TRANSCRIPTION FACTOR 1 [Linum perenne]
MVRDTHMFTYYCSSSSPSPAATSDHRRRPPAWLQGLIGESFFETCGTHVERRKNEKNVFCLLCCLTICPHCFPSHPSHPLLQVRRYVYHDVVRLGDLEKLIDCSYIQPYTINSAKVIFLKQRAVQSRCGKGGGGNICFTCDRILQHPFHFCSLSCKVEHMVEEGQDLSCIIPTVPSSDDMANTFSGFRTVSSEMTDDEGGGHVINSSSEVEPTSSSGDQYHHVAPEMIGRNMKNKKKRQAAGLIQAGMNALSLGSRRKGAPHRAPLS